MGSRIIGNEGISRHLYVVMYLAQLCMGQAFQQVSYPELEDAYNAWPAISGSATRDLQSGYLSSQRSGALADPVPFLTVSPQSTAWVSLSALIATQAP